MSSNKIDNPLFFGIRNVNSIETANLVTIGIPWDFSSSYRKGSAQAPDHIRQATTSDLYNPFSESLIDLREKFNLFDYGNINNSNLDAISCKDAVLKDLKSIYNRNAKCNFLFLGGDHLVTYFSVLSLVQSGFYNSKNVGIIYLDAHPDLYNDFEEDPYSHACVLRRILDDTKISPSNIFQVGIRASTPKQVKFANQNEISMISRKEFHRKGPEAIAQTINQSFNDTIDLVYLSIDMDILDPGIAPGLGNPEPGGLLTSELVDFIHSLSIPLHSFDIVEYNPKYDHSQITAFAAAKLIKETLPKIVLEE